MSKPFVKETLAQAKKMGLELSSDGNSWVPIEELVVKLPPENHNQLGIVVNKTKGDSTPSQWTFTIGIIVFYLLTFAAFATFIFVLIRAIILFWTVLGSGSGAAFG